MTVWRRCSRPGQRPTRTGAPGAGAPRVIVTDGGEAPTLTFFKQRLAQRRTCTRTRRPVQRQRSARSAGQPVTHRLRYCCPHEDSLPTLAVGRRRRTRCCASRANHPPPGHRAGWRRGRSPRAPSASSRPLPADLDDRSPLTTPRLATNADLRGALLSVHRPEVAGRRRGARERLRWDEPSCCRPCSQHPGSRPRLPAMPPARRPTGCSKAFEGAAAVRAHRRPRSRSGQSSTTSRAPTRCTGCCRTRSAPARRSSGALRAVMLAVVDASGRAALLARPSARPAAPPLDHRDAQARSRA